MNISQKLIKTYLFFKQSFQKTVKNLKFCILGKINTLSLKKKTFNFGQKLLKNLIILEFLTSYKQQVFRFSY